MTFADGVISFSIRGEANGFSLSFDEIGKVHGFALYGYPDMFAGRASPVVYFSVAF